jgi:hypothetical protein
MTIRNIKTDNQLFNNIRKRSDFVWVSLTSLTFLTFSQFHRPSSIDTLQWQSIKSNFIDGEIEVFVISHVHKIWQFVRTQIYQFLRLWLKFNVLITRCGITGVSHRNSIFFVFNDYNSNNFWSFVVSHRLFFFSWNWVNDEKLMEFCNSRERINEWEKWEKWTKCDGIGTGDVISCLKQLTIHTENSEEGNFDENHCPHDILLQSEITSNILSIFNSFVFSAFPLNNHIISHLTRSKSDPTIINLHSFSQKFGHGCVSAKSHKWFVDQ